MININQIKKKLKKIRCNLSILLRRIKIKNKQELSYLNHSNNNQIINKYPVAKLSVVLGSYNRKDLLKKTIKSVENNNIRIPYEIIVIDGGSNDGTIKWLTKQKNIISIIQHNHGEWKGQKIARKSWGYFMNLGFKIASGNIILMISDDCILLRNAVNNAMDILENNNEKIGGIAFYFRDYPIEKRYYVQKTLGGKMMVNHGLFIKKAMEEVGWIDESTYLFYKADGDLCLKLWQAGYKIIASQNSLVDHYFDKDEINRQKNNISLKHDRESYIKKWDGIFSFNDDKDLRGKIYLS